MPKVSPRHRFWFSLRTLFVVLTAAAVFAAWLSYELHWLGQRNRAREWITRSRSSWLAPDLVGARVRAGTPWGLRALGESGIVGIGIDAEESAEGTVPYTLGELQRLFPEARVDYSRDGVWVSQWDAREH